MQVSQHDPACCQRGTIRIQNGQPSGNQIGIDEIQNAKSLRYQPFRDRCLARTVGATDHDDMPRFNIVSCFLLRCHLKLAVAGSNADESVRQNQLEEAGVEFVDVAGVELPVQVLEALVGDQS